MVATHPDEGAKAYCNGPEMVNVLPDPLGHLAARFHASWTPRAYVVNAQGKLSYVQPLDAMEGDAIRQVGEHLPEYRRTPH